MESQDPFASIKECLLQLLDNVFDIGAAINKKSNILLRDINIIKHGDTSSLEKIGLGMIKTLETLYINVADITNSLEDTLEKVNEDRTKKLFEDLKLKILKYKKMLSTTDAIKCLNKDTQTEDSYSKSEVETDIKSEKSDRTYTCKSVKQINLGLIRTDTQDTEDCWVDSINRSPTAAELWNKSYQGGKINVTDEFLDELKTEQTEESAWDKQTEDLNNEFDRQISSEDDTFVDGKSFKSEEHLLGETDVNSVTVNLIPDESDPYKEANKKSDHLNPDNKEDNKSDTTSQLNTSDILEDTNHINDINSKKVGNEPNIYSNSKTADNCLESNCDTYKREDEDGDKSNSVIPKINSNVNSKDVLSLSVSNSSQNNTKNDDLSEKNKNIESCSDINNSLNLIKQRLVSNVTKNSNKEQDALSASTIATDLRENIHKEKVDTEEPDNASISSLDEDMSTELLKLADHLEIIAPADPTNEPVKENNDLSQTPTENLDNAKEIDFDSGKVLENVTSINSEHNEGDSDQMPETTYSQETVNLNIDLGTNDDHPDVGKMPDANETNVNEDINNISASQVSTDFSEIISISESNETSLKTDASAPVNETILQTTPTLEVFDKVVTDNNILPANGNLPTSDIDTDANNLSVSELQNRIDLDTKANENNTTDSDATEYDFPMSQTLDQCDQSHEKIEENDKSIKSSSDLKTIDDNTAAKEIEKTLECHSSHSSDTSTDLEDNLSRQNAKDDDGALRNSEVNLSEKVPVTEKYEAQTACMNDENKENNIETGNKDDCVNSKNLANNEGESSSSSSSQSFEFNVSQHLINLALQTSDIKDELAQSFDFNIIDTKDASNNTPKEETDNQETIELLSDSDDEIHLDVTMEEIVCNGSPAITKNDNEQEEDTQITKEAQDKQEQLKIDENKNQEVGDQLLELLREIEVPSIGPLKECERAKNKKEAKEASEIYSKLQEESDLSLSDSEVTDSDVNLSSSDIECLDDKLKNEDEMVLNNHENLQCNTSQLSSKVTITDCYVEIKKLHLESNAVIKLDKNMDTSIDRLCDISNIITKRKRQDSRENWKSKKTKKPVRSNQGISDSESLSNYSHSDSDNALHNNSTFATSFKEPLEQKLDEILANAIYKGLKNSSSNDSTDVDSDGSNKSVKKEKNTEKGKHCDVRKKHLLSKKERKKKAWKNDPLLRGKLTSDESTSSSTSDSESSLRKRRALRSKYEHDTDFNLLSEETESDSNASDNLERKKILLDDKIISPIKMNIPSSDSSTETDSDIEIIVLKPGTPKKDPDAKEDTSPGISQKGRRNIRALLSDETLAEATQKANREEQERIERLQDRRKIKESFSQSFSQPEEDDILVLDVDALTGDPLITIHPKLNRRLKPHQKSGIQFMWDSCYESLERLKEKDYGSGCILAHCMGLGKTFQVLTLLHTLFSYEATNTKHVLVVCPASTVNNWKKEAKIAFKHFTNDKLNIRTIVDQKEISHKYDIVRKWYSSEKGVLVMGYECFETLTNEIKLSKLGNFLKTTMLGALIDPGPDLVICDEGHLLRNKKALKTLALNKITTKRRIVLTGTPLQNNLLEYYYMVDFVKPNLLGNLKEYKTNFVNPITNGQYEDSTAEDIKLMMKRTHVLHKLLKKTIQRVEDTELKIYLPKMVDHAVFIQLHQVQVDLYHKFSQLVERNSANTNKRGFLSDFSIFQYICTHPHLLAVMDNLRNKKIKERDLITNVQEDNPMCNIQGWWKALMPADVEEKIEYGNKLLVLKSVIEECEEIGDKVLVFSQSLGELDLIEHFLKKIGTSKCQSWKKRIDYSRIDGTVSPALRSTICDLFNDRDNMKLRLLLMSTKVGGLGLNLTAANRVIIMTVNWNPSYDIQSVFRVYRFGQEKEVYVYRLIALDSMEEKVYQRTVTKLAIAHRVVDKHQITRHYKSMDLQELYSCRPSADIERPISNVPEDKVLAKLILKLPCIFKHHEHQALLANRPEDNLNEQELSAAWDEFKRIKDAPQMPPVVPQPQPISTLPQIPQIPNGPTFSMAFGLTRPTTSAADDQILFGGRQNGTPGMHNHFLTKPIETLHNRTERKQVPRIIKRTPKTSTEEDPLFIPFATDNRNRTYSEKLNMVRQSNFAIPNLPSNLSISLDKPVEKYIQKKNLQGKKYTATSEGNSTNVLGGENINGLPKSNNFHNPGAKRKRNDEIERQNMLKRIKESFNSVMPSTTVNIEDDELVISDSEPETESLSNEVINNLRRSDISIHKVINKATRPIVANAFLDLTKGD